MTIDTDIDALASHVAREAVKTGTDAPPFEEKVEALKTLTAYRAMLLRRKATVGGDEDEDTPSFDQFAAEIKDAENGQVATRSNRGRARHG